jgi:hypothetical protein
VVATNVCFEPTVGLLIRRELLMRSVRFNGDILTQALSHVAQLEWEWVQGWTVDLVRFLLEDEEHGAANGEVLSGWLADWQPFAEDAAMGVQAVFDDLPAGIPFEQARANVQIDVDQLMEECGLSERIAASGRASGGAS